MGLGVWSWAVIDSNKCTTHLQQVVPAKSLKQAASYHAAMFEFAPRRAIERLVVNGAATQGVLEAQCFKP